MKNLIEILFIVFSLLVVGWGNAQETLNANDPSSYIFGGGQLSNTAEVELLEVQLIDVEPEPNNNISFGVIDGAELEAGKSVFGGSAGINEDLWLNFSIRKLKNQTSSISVFSTQAVPVGMSIEIQIIAIGTSGDFTPSQVIGAIEVSPIEQTIVNSFDNGFTEDSQGMGYQLQYKIINPNNLSLPSGFEINYKIN